MREGSPWCLFSRTTRTPCHAHAYASCVCARCTCACMPLRATVHLRLHASPCHGRFRWLAVRAFGYMACHTTSSIVLCFAACERDLSLCVACVCVCVCICRRQVSFFQGWCGCFFGRFTLRLPSFLVRSSERVEGGRQEGRKEGRIRSVTNRCAPSNSQAWSPFPPPSSLGILQVLCVSMESLHTHRPTQALRVKGEVPNAG